MPESTEQDMPVNELAVVDLVKTIRARDGLSLEALGRLMGVSYVTVSHWQSGKRVPQARHLRRLRELAKNETNDTAFTGNRVLCISPLPDAAALLAQMARDASAVLGLDIDVHHETDGMRALVQLGALKPAIVFVTYPMANLNVLQLIEGHCDVAGVDVDLFVLVTESRGSHPAVNIKKRNVVSVSTPITLAAVGAALRHSALAKPAVAAHSAAEK